jgi:hypothetical protein
VRQRATLLGISLSLVLVTAACERNPASVAGKTQAPATSASSTAASSPPAPPPGNLPEDADAGKKASAEWHQHLAHEEEERQLGYDRHRLPQHRGVVKLLMETRRRYDAAGTKGAVLSAEKAFRATVPDLDARLDAIDHWGVSSKVLPDYRALVTTFSEAYPNARSAALAGDTSALERVKGDVEARFKAIDAWLHEAEESEDD